jgi:hypothetical protein
MIYSSATSNINGFYNQSQGYSGQASSAGQTSGVLSLASSFAGIIGSMIDYDTLKRDSVNYEIQADEVELQAKQRANQLREQFNQAAGSYQVSAAQRGIDIKSGSVRSNLESSAINLGKDIQKESENAAMKAKGLRTQAKIARKQGKAQMYGQIASGIMDMAKTGLAMGA